MLQPLVFLVTIGLIILWIIFQRVILAFQRKRIAQQPFPERWLAIIIRNVAIYHYLDHDRHYRTAKRSAGFPEGLRSHKTKVRRAKVVAVNW